MLPKHVSSYERDETNSSSGDQEEMEITSGEFNPIQRFVTMPIVGVSQ
jgi:hypothetical protein